LHRGCSEPLHRIRYTAPSPELHEGLRHIFITTDPMVEYRNIHQKICGGQLLSISGYLGPSNIS
jgi:hypothetical protein